MSADALAVNLDYYDGRSRLIDKKCRILSQIALRRMPKENYCEIRISSKKTMDMFIAQIIVIINESCTPTTVCAWIPSYKCRITISGAEPQIKQIKEFFDGTTSGAEASNNKENREINSTPDKQCSSGKRGFGIVAKDLFRSGLTPEGKVQTKAEKSPIAVPQRRPQNTFMGLLTTAVSQTAATKAHSTSSSSAPVAYELTPVQHQVVSACLAGRNVFYTGGAGTGKSTLLTVLIEKLAQVHGRQAVFVAATTGLAACAIGGTTVHQFAGISARLEDHGTSAELKAQHDRIVAQSCSKAGVLKRLRDARVLLVDEISMLSPTLLEILNSIAQRARGVKKPMGGLQVVFCGDFFQLPPVSVSLSTSGFGNGGIKGTNTGTVTASSKAAEARRFCFQSPLWGSLIEASFDLKVVYRQGEDHDFIAALNAVRQGELLDHCVSAFRACVGRKLSCGDGILPTQIFTHKRDVDQLNTVKLAELPGSPIIFEASDSGDEAYLRMIQSHCPARSRLELKVGAQVILVKTTAMLEGLVNGARGIITRFAKESNQPVVKFGDGIERVIGNELFSVSLGGTIVAQRSQVPLDLSWGISVHKAQGMTVDKAHLHLKNVFECGQAYVALSRVRSLAGLSLSHPLLPGQVRAHPEVLKFYSNMHALQDSSH